MPDPAPLHLGQSDSDPARRFDVDPAVDLARALRELVNAPLPEDSSPERAFWRACRNARATLSLWEHRTGIDGEMT